MNTALLLIRPGTMGVEIHSCVAPQEGEVVLVKHVPSAFRETAVQELLTRHGITHLVVADMMTHMCVGIPH